MKKIYIAMAVIGTVALSSCVREKSFNDITVGENEIAFVLQNASTRSADEASIPVEKGITIPMGTTEDGEALFLEETIEDLNPSPATKGTPAYTTNVGELYTTMGVYAAGNFGDSAFEVIDQYAHKGDPKDGINTNGWRYHHNYNGSPWPDETTPVDFYLRMPAEGTGVSNLSYADKKITFELTSPLQGADQQDLLFAQTTLTKKQHHGYLPNGAPVLMYHALTGIKFRNGHLNDNQTKTIITGVELIGLKGSGKGTFNPADGTFTWPTADLGTPSTQANPFRQAFNNPEYVKEDGASNPDGTVGSSDWNSKLGSSWTSAAADHNLNDANGSLTFWFIPQEITDDVVLKIYFTVKTPDSVEGFRSDACHTIELGKLLNEKYKSAGKSGNLKWEAGQIRTYTLSPYDVDVDIKDTMTETVKSNLHIANTGNVDEYVRMLIMGNWYGWKSKESKDAGDEPSILVGYKYPSKKDATDAHDEDRMIDPWYREGYDHDGDEVFEDPYGTFDNTFKLANLGSRDGKKNDWADASGGFYYTMPIGPGDGVNKVESATKDLFASYTVDPTKIPTIYIATSASQRVPAYGVHLRMEIVVQAIAVPKKTVDGVEKKVWWLDAWQEATGIDKLKRTYTKDGKKPNQKYVDLFEQNEYGDDMVLGHEE